MTRSKFKCSSCKKDSNSAARFGCGHGGGESAYCPMAYKNPLRNWLYGMFGIIT